MLFFQTRDDKNHRHGGSLITKFFIYKQRKALKDRKIDSPGADCSRFCVTLLYPLQSLSYLAYIYYFIRHIFGVIDSTRHLVILSAGHLCSSRWSCMAASASSMYCTIRLRRTSQPSRFLSLLSGLSQSSSFAVFSQ